MESERQEQRSHILISGFFQSATSILLGSWLWPRWLIPAADKEQCQIIGYITDMTKGWRDGTTWIRGVRMPTDVKTTDDASKIFIESEQDGGRHK